MSYQDDLSPPPPRKSKFGFLSIRALLVTLIAGIMVPMLGQVAVLAWSFGIACQQTIEAQRLDVASNIAYLIDREIQGRAGFLSGVGLAPSFQAGQPDVVKSITSKALERGFGGLALFDAEGRLKFASPPAMQSLFAHPEQLGMDEIAKGNPVFVSDFLALEGGRPSQYVVSVPIVVDGKLAFVLSGASTAKRIQGLFADPEAGLRDSWTAGVVDRRGIIVARSQRPEAFVGMEAQQPLADIARRGEHTANFDGISRDGISMVNTTV